MKSRFAVLACLLVGSVGLASATDDPPVTNATVPAFTRFLEAQPLDPRAAVVRALMLEWEGRSKDIVDTVCPGVLAPLPSKDVKYSGELLAQFIFGSAAFQLEHPSEKGRLMPAQLAGMTSLLHAYRSLLAEDPAARVPRLDALAAAQSDGSLEAVLAPLVEEACR